MGILIGYLVMFTSDLLCQVGGGHGIKVIVPLASLNVDAEEVFSEESLSCKHKGREIFLVLALSPYMLDFELMDQQVNFPYCMHASCDGITLTPALLCWLQVQ